LLDDHHLSGNHREIFPDAFFQGESLPGIGVALVQVHVQARVAFGDLCDGSRHRQTIDVFRFLAQNSALFHDYGVDLTRFGGDRFKELLRDIGFRAGRFQLAARLSPAQAPPCPPDVEFDRARRLSDQNGHDQVWIPIGSRR